MRKVMKGALTVVYLCGLCYLVFFARRREGMQRTPASRLVNVVPVVHQVTTFKMMNPNKLKEVWNFFANLVGNVLLFVPFSGLLYAYGFRNKKQVLFAALLMSGSIEVAQYFFRIGVADVDDVLLNTGGAYLGILLSEKLFPKVRPGLNRNAVK